MRRVIGLILVGLGAFFIVLALFSWLYVPGQVLKFPLNEYQVATLHDPNGSYFSAGQLKVLSVPVTATDTLQGDVAAGDSGTAVWKEFTSIRDDVNNVNFNYFERRAPFDRRTGVLINCCGHFVNDGSGNRIVPLSGQGFVFPIGAQKTTYQIFDVTLGRAVPIRYVSTETIDGLQTYKYVEQVSPPQQFDKLTLPGNLVGMNDQPAVTLPEFYQATNTYWVDPVTGGPVKVEQKERRTLQDSTGATRLVLFNADLTFSPQSVQSFVNNDVNGKNKVTLITFTIPLILVLLGLVNVGVGTALLVVRGGEAGERATSEGFERQDQGLAPH